MSDRFEETVRRRQYLKATTVAGLVGLAGCSSIQGDTDSEPRQKDQSSQTVQNSQDEAAAESIARDPIISEQLVVAHYMSGMMPHGFPEEAPTDPALYDPSGISGQIGGAHQTIPLLRLLHGADMNPVEMAKYEMECATRFGIDGFDFYYPYTADGRAMRRYHESIVAFFEAAERFDLDFRLTLCFSHPIGPATQDEKIKTFAAPARAVMDAVGRDSSSWLRTDDGRILFYTWHPDALLDRLGTNPWLVRRRPDLVSGIAEAYNQLAEAIGVEAAWMYSMHYPDGRRAYINEVIEQFPAIKGWVSNCEEVEQWDYIAKRAQDRGTVYSQDVYGDFYDGMPKYTSSGDGIHQHEELGAVTVDEIVRDVHILDLSHNFRAQLERATERGADLINVATWNDYLEGHHVAPEINHNFGFAQLLHYYVAQWRDAPQGVPDETAIAFFKKYPWRATPDPYDVELNVEARCVRPAGEDLIEVVTILDAPATVRINEQPAANVAAGVDVVRVPMEPGPVTVRVSRDGSVVKQFTTPEWITEQPFRTDRLTYSYSSEHERLSHELFGVDATRHSSQQYAQDEDGVPNWQRDGTTTDLI